MEDLDQVEQRLQARGYQTPEQGQTADYDEPYRRCVYYYDHAGFEWEFIECPSENPQQRNDYETT